MWAPVILALCVGAVSCEHAWKEGREYEYEVTAKTLTGLHQVADQYAGVLVQAQLIVQPNAPDQLSMELRNARYADVHRNLSGGWASAIPKEELSFQILPLQNKPFKVQMKNGTVEQMTVDNDLSAWEVNFLKGIVSQLQVDTEGENLKKSKVNMTPQKGQPFGNYKTMEDSVNGIYETMYDISPLPEYVVQSRPEIAPLPHLKGEGDFIDIVKTRNFSNSEQHMVYRFGASGNEGWKAGSNRMGNFLSRSSVSRIVISGNLKQYTIHSSVTDEKVVVAPHLHNSQKGIVAGQMNLTLRAVKEPENRLQTVSNPKVIKGLVYQYTEGNKGHFGGSSEEVNSASMARSSSSSSSSSESSSSEENKNTIAKKMRDGEAPNSQESSESNSASSSSSSSGSSSSSSQSSSEEYLAENPDLNEAPRIEFHNYFSDNQDSQQDNVNQIKRAAQEVAQWIHNPSQISDKNNPSSAERLVQLVASANNEQLQQATELLYYPESKAQQQTSSEGRQNFEAWLAFRDSVAQAGTGPALVTLRSWIDSDKVQGEEAAQLLAVLPNSARYPTTAFMDYFFEMMKSEKVQKQGSLNTSAIIAFTDLVRKSQVDEESSRNRYTIHLRSSDQHGRTVKENYIPYLQSQLKKATAQGDSVKIQVYIRALGNTAHPQIMAVYEPYLEGKESVSTFQRLSIVASLDEMTRVHPNLARRVLYRIYQNQGDAAEIRVAAVMQLMKTNPPAQMLQRMAEQTNYDPSQEVNSAVKSAIESAASGSSHANHELKNNARSAANLLNPKTYGAQFSKNFLRSFIVNEQEQLQYQQQFSYIQGQDSILPKSIAYNVHRQIGGYNREPFTAAFSLSSAEELLNLLQDQVSSRRNAQQQKEREQNSEFSYEKIRNMLNLQTDEQMQVEGNMLIHLLGGKRFFSFDNHTIEKIPKVFREYQEKMKKGINVHQSKYYNQYSMELGFPMITGLPFVYSLSVPTLVSISGHLTGNASPQGNEKQQNTGVNGSVQITYSAQKKGKMGFIAPFSNQRYISSAEKSMLVHLPVQGKLEYNSNENRVEATLEPHTKSQEKKQLFYFGNSINTVIQSKQNILRGGQHGMEAKPIQKRRSETFKTTIGQKESGYALDIEMSTGDRLWDMSSFWKVIQNHDLISAYLFHDMEQTTTNSYVSVQYNPQKSKPQPVKVGISYLEEEKEESARITEKLNKLIVRMKQSRKQRQNLAEPWTQEHRREELLRNAKEGIQDAKARVVDAYISFGEEQNQNGYSITLAHANSPVSKTSRLLAHLRGNPIQPSTETKPNKVSVQITVESPQLPGFDYKQALNADPTTQINALINLSQGSESSGKISFKGVMRRSNERKEFLQWYPLSKVCLEQMEEGNNIQPSCRNATLNAHYLDQYKFVVKYQDIPKGVQQALNKIYGSARQASYGQHEENTVNVKNPEGQLNIDAQFKEDLSSLNVSLTAPRLSARFSDVRVSQLAIPFAVYHPRYNKLELIAQKLLHSQPPSTAVLDGNSITTFNNKTYPIDLGNCYHVFAMHAPHSDNERRQGDSLQNFAVLVKETDSKRKEVQIVVGSDTISLEPSGSAGVNVKVNGQNIETSHTKVTWRPSSPKLEAYSNQDKTTVIKLPSIGLQLIHDGSRFQLSLNNSYRNRVRGLAGTFDNEQSEDFTLPDNRILADPLQFASTYALADAACQGPAKERQQQALRSPSFRKRILFGNVVSDREAGRSDQLNSKKNQISKEQRSKAPSCTMYAVKTVEDNGRTCFSTRPHVKCSSSCKATRNIEKAIDFHCMQKSSTSFKWLEMIKKGQIPDVASRVPNLKVTVSLPERCIPN